MKPIVRYFASICFTCLFVSGCLSGSPSGSDSAAATFGIGKMEPEQNGQAVPAPESAEARAERARILSAEARLLAAYGRSAADVRRSFDLAREASKLSSDHALLLGHAALLAAQLTEDIKEKASFARPALAAVIAGKSDPRNAAAEVAYYHGVLFGLVLQEEGLSAAGKLPEMEEVLNRAATRPGTDHGGPDRALGMLYLRAPAWPTGIGDLDLALEKLERVADDYPEFPLNQIGYAEALLEDGRADEAGVRLDRAGKALSSGKWGAFQTVWDGEIEKLRARIKP